MRLVDLDPRWIEFGGRRVGFLFRCPTNRERWMSCFVAKTSGKAQRALLDDMLGEDNSHTVQACKPECQWTATPPIDEATFENLSIAPSLDGSPGGNWHGFITAGAIVGGL